MESSVEIIDNNVVATNISNNKKRIIPSDTKASMSLFLFNPTIFKYIEKYLKMFLETRNLEQEEFFLPDVIDNIIKNKEGTIEVIDTNSNWYGVTYKEDLEYLKINIEKLIKDGKYTNKLW